jgi:hypothetical protein
MSQPWHVHYPSDDLTVQTVGLAAHRQAELRVAVPDRVLLPDAYAFLGWLVHYLEMSGNRVVAGENVTHGFWMVHFDAAPDGVLDAWEYGADGSGYVPGATMSLTAWRDQHAVYDSVGAEFDPPVADSLAVTDDGVLAQEPLQLVRYPSPPHMSGGWITSARSNRGHRAVQSCAWSGRRGSGSAGIP